MGCNNMYAECTGLFHLMTILGDVRWISRSRSRPMSFKVIALCSRHYLCFAQSNDAISISTISDHTIFPTPQMQLALELKPSWLCASMRTMEWIRYTTSHVYLQCHVMESFARIATRMHHFPC